MAAFDRIIRFAVSLFQFVGTEVGSDVDIFWHDIPQISSLLLGNSFRLGATYELSNGFDLSSSGDGMSIASASSRLSGASGRAEGIVQ